MAAMLPVAEARSRLLALAAPVPVETVPLAHAAGRWLAEPVTALRDQPAADLSAMDGYAIRYDDLPGPWTVVGESAAGAGLDRRVGPGEAARIFTGAPLPEGTDTILIQEDAVRYGDRLTLSGAAPARRGLSVRARGSDFTCGAALIEAGTMLTPPRIALAAIAGHGMLAVRRPVRIIILSTGDELVPPGTPAEGVMLPASNGPMLAAMLSGPGVVVDDRGIVADDLDSLARAFADAARDADVVVTTGGASVGDRDLVRPALAQAGATLDFWRVAMRPGKPLMAGTLGGTVVVGLPGNPVSAFVTALLFLRPVVRHRGGAAVPLPVAETMPLAASAGANGPRAAYLRAQIEDGTVRILADQDSAGLAALARADALVVRPPHAGPAPAGEEVEILRLA